MLQVGIKAALVKLKLKPLPIADQIDASIIHPAQGENGLFHNVPISFKSSNVHLGAHTGCNSRCKN